jgi:hypothetical protein
MVRREQRPALLAAADLLTCCKPVWEVGLAGAGALWFDELKFKVALEGGGRG